jgi:RNA polymerase sigma-70 factor, ECF subfamily
MKERSPSGLDDRELVRISRDGDLEAFEELVTRHERRIYNLARRITGSDEDAQDVTQQTFLGAMQNLSGFREKSSFFTWLATIAANAALKVVRKRRGLPTISLDEATTSGDDNRVPHPEYIADWRDNPERLIHSRETRKLLDSAIAELDPGYRAVFLLRDVEELSVKDTARALHLSEGNVKVRLLRARLQLRERLTRVFGDENSRYAPVDHGHGDQHKRGERK